MDFRRIATLLSVSFGCLTISVLQTTAQSPNTVQVDVTGRGTNIEAARSDAIRQALQQVVRQLVVVDRVVKNDRLVQDKIMATMNGYIDDFKETGLNKSSDGLVSINCHVTVSSARMLNFIGLSDGGTSPIAGGLLSVDAQRQILQRRAVGEIFDHLLRGFPTYAMEAKVTGATPRVEDPRKITLSIKVGFSKHWLDSLVSGLAALAIGKLESTESDFRAANPNFRGNEIPRSWFKSNVDEKVVTAILKGDFGREWGAKFCIYNKNSAVCYFLPLGNYGNGLLIPHKPTYGGWSTPWPVLTLRFIKEKNQPTDGTPSVCIIRDLYENSSMNENYPKFRGQQGNIGNFRVYGNVSGPVEMYIGESFAIDNQTGDTNIVLGFDDIDFSSVTSVAAVPFIAGARMNNGDVWYLSNAMRNQKNPVVVSDISTNTLIRGNICDASAETL